MLWQFAVTFLFLWVNEETIYIILQKLNYKQSFAANNATKMRDLIEVELLSASMNYVEWNIVFLCLNLNVSKQILLLWRIHHNVITTRCIEVWRKGVWILFYDIQVLCLSTDLSVWLSIREGLIQPIANEDKLIFSINIFNGRSAKLQRILFYNKFA